MENATVYIFDWHEFEDLVKANFEGYENWDFVISEEASNDSDHFYRNVAADQNSELDKKEVYEIRRQEYITHTLLIELVDKEVLPAGNYLIRVCW
ncbi:MAG TPA: hypothetical protein VJ742_12750 [Nitrososphaera sp.]|nr:hypothetical protein [Nitrososphaera sp.]